MEQRASLEPPEEEEEESPVVNGNGVAITPGARDTTWVSAGAASCHTLSICFPPTLNRARLGEERPLPRRLLAWAACCSLTDVIEQLQTQTPAVAAVALSWF